MVASVSPSCVRKAARTASSSSLLVFVAIKLPSALIVSGREYSSTSITSTQYMPAIAPLDTYIEIETAA